MSKAIFVALAIFVVGCVAEDRCPEQNHKGEKLYHLRHVECTKFYKCNHGQRVEFTCPDGQYFNPLYSVCDHPNKVKCEPIASCPKNPTKLNHLPHVECAKFYKCDFGIPIEHSCPAGQHFNPRMEICFHADPKNCSRCKC